MSTEFIGEDELKYILSLPAGRKVIWDLLATFGLYRNPRVPGDPEGTSFQCGLLNAGQILYAECMSASPDLTAMMIKEQGNDDNRLDKQPEPRRDDSGHVSAVQPTDLGADDLGGSDPLGLGFDRSGG